MTDKREQILEAAEHVFAEKGYHEAGIADIAARLGMGHGTFYRYFKNKHDIAAHVLERVIERFAAPAFQEDPSAANSLAEYRAQVERLLGGMAALVDTHPTVVRFLHEQAHIIAPQRLWEMIDTYAEYTELFLENGVNKGFLRPGIDRESTAQALVALVLEGTRRSLRQAPEQRARWTAAGVALMFCGVALRDR